MTEHDLMTTSEAAAVLHVHRRTVLRWVHSGRLPAIVTPGGHLRFARGAVESLPLTTGEVARQLGVGRRTVVRWCEGGKLRAWRRPGSDTWEVDAGQVRQLAVPRPPERKSIHPGGYIDGATADVPPAPSGMARNPVIFAALKRIQKAREEEVFGGRPPKAPPRRKPKPKEAK